LPFQLKYGHISDISVYICGQE